MTTVGYIYQVDVSADLTTWVNTAIEEQGTGALVTYAMPSNADTLFYRVRESLDFLVLPEQNDDLDLTDGVCFAFDLNVLPELPAKIRIYRRPDSTLDPWEQIGLLTEFEIDGIRFVRGSAVWIPDTVGEYEVLAEAVNAQGDVIASLARHITIGENQPPTVVITGGPPTPSSSPEFFEFTAEVEDPDGDEISRVEFYDNGVLVGMDKDGTATADPDIFEFGDYIQDIEGHLHELLRGTHNITAKAYDSRGAVGETTTAFPVEIEEDQDPIDYRPTIAVTDPLGSLMVSQGQNFTVAYDEGDLDGASDIVAVEAYDIHTYYGDRDTTSPFDDLTIDTAVPTLWEPGTHTIRVLARDDAGEKSYPLYLTVYVRTGTGPTFAETLAATIADENSAVPSAEVFTGVQASSGGFEDGGDSGLDIDSGVILTTGLSDNWNAGDIDDGEVNGTPWYAPGDLELEGRVTGWKTYDAAALDFDVDCANGQLEIDFQFGSEEYVEYVAAVAGGMSRNDAFMIAVDDVIVSLVPDCSDIVAVNSVHPAITAAESEVLSEDLDARNEFLYMDDDEIRASLDPINQPVQVEYDGMTIRLRAHAFVVPNETHHIRLVIADVDDDRFDSALFVKEGSVRTIQPTP